MSECITRRSFFGAASAVAAPVALGVPPAKSDAEALEEDRCPGDWTFADHPWAGRFMVAIGLAIDACRESHEKARTCHCGACMDMVAFWTVLEMFNNALEGGQYGTGCVEWYEREARECERDKLRGGSNIYRKWADEARAAGHWAYPRGIRGA